MSKHPKSFMGDRHKGGIPRHFTKRLHERFGIGARLCLADAVANAIAANDESKVRYIRDTPKVWRRHDQREEWLANIAGSYVVVAYSPKYQQCFTCMRVLCSMEAIQLRDRVKTEGGLQPFWEGVSKVPAGRAIAR